MYVPEELTELHASFQLKTQADAIGFVACLTRMTVPGEVDAIFLDDDRRIVELFRMTDAEPLLPEFVYCTCSPDEEWVTGLLLVTDRTGRVPLDAPDDELRWQELLANAAKGGVTLYDWFVTAERRWAYSLPEYAPTPPQW